jgi:hypothetical protein
MKTWLWQNLINKIDAKLGRCPFCMRTALLGALASWLAVAALAVIKSDGPYLICTVGIACLFTLLAMAHLIAVCVRASHALRRAVRQSQPDATQTVLGRRTFMSTVLRTGAAFTLVAVSGRSFGLGGQSTSCSEGSNQGGAGGGGQSKGEAQGQTKKNAVNACQSACSPRDACPATKPNCKGSVAILTMDCHLAFPSGWSCFATYQCTCGCSKSG